MSEDKSIEIEETNDAGTETATIDTGDTLETLQRENEQLKTRIEQLSEARAEHDSLALRLTQAELENEQLRGQHAELALSHAIETAALNLGISAEAAGVYRGRFTCEMDDDGQPRIEPDPGELLAAELEGNPLLRESIERGRQDRQAAAVANGAAETTEVDPVELITALDRNAAREAQFIARHGTQAFLDLADAARRKGYAG